MDEGDCRMFVSVFEHGRRNGKAVLGMLAGWARVEVNTRPPAELGTERLVAYSNANTNAKPV